MNSAVTIGTRGSQLALWQASFVKQQLAHHFPDIEVNLKIIKTKGDTIQNRSLIGLGKGVFTKEIEISLLNGEIDLAVHSLKDLPTDLPEGLCIAAIPTREDPRDVLVTSTGFPLEDLLNGAKIGTTSPRRKAQLLHIRPDLQVVDVRGNVDTRIRKLEETDLDGIILAAAGIKRLLKEEVITQYFEIEQMVPAVGQGALAIEAREGDSDIEKLLAPLNDFTTAAEITAERTVLENLGGGCQLPIGAYAEHVDGELSLIGTVCHPEGRVRIVERITGKLDDAQHLGRIVAEKLQNSGANELLKIQLDVG
ncbi:MAG: hydroxymethylbilane synthase [Candidatus Poribacteria bacterium]|nr:hydroxymethylbilane synthase [Candidatus Poribacteria bacterium]